MWCIWSPVWQPAHHLPLFHHHHHLTASPHGKPLQWKPPGTFNHANCTSGLPIESLPRHPQPNANSPYHQPTTFSLPLPSLRDVGIHTPCHVIRHISTLEQTPGILTEGWAYQQGIRCINRGCIDRGAGILTGGGHIDRGQVDTGGTGISI